jgi:hypothetical protein
VSTAIPAGYAAVGFNGAVISTTGSSFIWARVKNVTLCPTGENPYDHVHFSAEALSAADASICAIVSSSRHGADAYVRSADRLQCALRERSAPAFDAVLLNAYASLLLAFAYSAWLVGFSFLGTSCFHRIPVWFRCSNQVNQLHVLITFIRM